MTWAEEHETSIARTGVEAECGPTTVNTVKEIHEKAGQAYVVFFTIAHHSPNGHVLVA